MDENQLEKLKKMKALLDDDKASNEEVAKMFASVLNVITTVKDTLDKNIAQNKGELSDTINEVYSLLKGHEKDITKTIKDLEQKVAVDNKAVTAQLLGKINEVKGLIPEVPSFKPLEDKLAQIEKKIPTLPDLKPFETKLSELEKKIPVLDNKRLDDIERIARANAMPITTSFVNGIRAKNINFAGATVTHQGDTANVTITGGTGAVDSVNGQTGVVVLDADDIDDTATTNKFATGSNTGDVTLAGEDYLSITNQVVTANAIDLDNLSATGTPSSSTFLRGDNTWATPAGSGDVSKVGTPVDNQVGVWTGDGTLEGTSGLTYNGTVLAVTGDVTVSDEAYGAGWNGSLEVPTKNAVYDKIETISGGGISEELSIAYAVAL